MSYLEHEVSSLGGFPMEAYKFSSNGFAAPYLYTNIDEDTSIGIDAYKAIYIRRSQPELSRDTRAQQLTITVDRENELARRWLITVPPQPVFLTIFRIHRNDGGTPEVATFWQGKVRSVDFVDNEAQFTAQPIDFSFTRVGLRKNFGPTCSHMLGDSGCKLLLADISELVTVETVSGVTITSLDFQFFPSSSLPTPNGWYVTGVLQKLSTGEQRMILTHVTNTITVLSPFEDLQIGDQCRAIFGDDHAQTTCEIKFNNLINYSGYNFVPGEDNNPFSRSLLQTGG